MTPSRSQSSSGRGKREPSAAPDEPQFAPECYACPIGTAFQSMQKATPEATEHLIRAGREFVLALRSLLDGAALFLDEVESRRAEAPTIESIPIRRPT